MYFVVSCKGELSDSSCICFLSAIQLQNQIRTFLSPACERLGRNPKETQIWYDRSVPTQPDSFSCGTVCVLAATHLAGFEELVVDALEVLRDQLPSGEITCMQAISVSHMHVQLICVSVYLLGLWHHSYCRRSF